MHDESELAYLKAEWGNFGCIKRVTITGYNAVAAGEPAVIDRGPPQIFDVNTFGSTRNRPALLHSPRPLNLASTGPVMSPLYSQFIPGFRVSQEIKLGLRLTTYEF